MNSSDPGPAGGDARQRALLRSMAEGMVEHAMDGSVVQANPAASAILGLSHDQLLGVKPVDPRWRAIHEDGSPWPGAEHPAMVALGTGRPQRGQVMGIATPDGGLRWIVINACPIREGEAAPTTGVVASFVDITERRALQARLAAAADEWADLYDNAPCCYHTLDASGRFVRMNATGLAWLGCTREEVEGRLGPADFMTDEGKVIFLRNFPRLMSGEALPYFEQEVVGRHGQRRWVSVSASVIRSADGRSVGARSVLSDITELRRARQELERVNAEQAALMDTELIGLMKVQARHFTWVSDGASRMFGYAPGELVGQPTRVIYASDADYQSVPDAIPPNWQPGHSIRFQLEMLRKDGSRLWVDLRTEQLSGGAGEALGVFVDISASKRAEAARIRSAELAAENTQLRETGRLKDEFLSNLSHELRTPLNAVIGFAQLLQRSPPALQAPKQANYLRLIGESGQHLLGLVEGMLDHAKAAAGRMSFAVQAVDVRAAIAEVAEMLEPAVQAAALELRVTIAPDLVTVTNDPLRLRQMLLNLVGNAVKFSRPGGRVAVRAHGLDATRWRMEIEDQGIGIAEADLRRLFTPFVQLSSGATKAYAGTGLGLALVRGIARAQGGEVDVHSRLGEGSVFGLVLPRALPVAVGEAVTLSRPAA